METYPIPECNLDTLKAQIAKLDAKARKLGCSPIALDVLSFKDRTDEWGNVWRVYTVSVTGEAPRLNGWRFAAKLEHGPNGNMLFVLPGETLPEAYRTCDPWCDHCQLYRERKDTYVVINDAGEYKQVGSSCLRDFTGHDSPQSAAKAAEYILIACQLCDEASYDGESILRCNRVDLRAYLEYVSAEIRANGWISRTKATDVGGSASADCALIQLTSANLIDERNRLHLDDKDAESASAAIAWVRSEIANKESPNDYEWNLGLAFLDDSITYRACGIVASAIPAYQRALARKRAHETESASTFQGTIKQRQMWERLTLQSLTYLDGLYGVTVLHKFTDAAGNVFVWFASNAELTPGETYAGKATVKAHKEYKGIQQTVLTRCKFDKVS